MVNLFKATPMLLFALLTMACSSLSHKATLYDELGKQEKLEEITNFFIKEISFDAVIYPYFEKTNVKRFRVKFTEYLCVKADGPCVYSGDNMLNVHAGQNISEAVFNHTVELFISAMDKAQIHYTLQNQLLLRLIPTRKEMLYK